ncbi:MAG: SOS response-associated peptidase family protein [Pseudomonadota bacterium]
MFRVKTDDDYVGNAPPLSAIWPKYEAPVVRLSQDGDRELVNMSWGFLTKKVSKKSGKELSPAAWNNARDEKVRSSGLWRRSFEEPRCLVPATSFREAKGQRPATDYWFALKGDEPRPLFALQVCGPLHPRTYASRMATLRPTP